MDISFKKDTIENGSNNSKKSKFIKAITNFDSNVYFFLFLCIVGLAFFADSLFSHEFTTLFGGDYTAQQLSFYTNGYDDWWHFLRTGEFVFFDTNTYLGSSNIGSNSFYYLFDPFFMPILICPREFIAQGMALLTIFKIATSAMFFMAYMKYMGASKNASRISAFAYAFCGWMSWFLWFNHMTEIMIVFPIMLWGVERILREKKPWLLMFGVFLMGLTNYFFLIGMTIAAFFYAIFRFFQRLKLNSAQENWKILGIGFLGFAAGLLLSCCVVLPSAMTALSAPRAANSNYLDLLKQALKNKQFGKFFSYIFEWKNFSFGSDADTTFRSAFPLINFFFPCASCRGTPLTQYGNESYDNVATNIYCFVPMMLFFFPAFVKAMKQKKWSVIVATVLFIVALETPFCYYMFFGFTSPYGRWELFFITSFITFSGLHIDDSKDDPLWADVVSYVFIIGMIIFAGAMAQHLIDTNNNFIQRSPYINATQATLIMCGYTTVVFLALLFTKKKEETRQTLLTCFVAFEAIVMGYLTIEGHWCESFQTANNGLSYNNALYQLNQRIAKEDKSYYRCWSYLQNEGARNDGMRNNYNGLGCFHSLYNFNLNNFVDWTRIQDGSTFGGWGSWAGSYVWKNTDIDKFLGVKYYFIQQNSPQWFWMANGDYHTEFQYNVPLDFEDVTEHFNENTFEVFQDQRNVNFAFAFNNIISYRTEVDSPEALYADMPYYNSESVLANDELLLKGALIDEKNADEIVSRYPNISSAKVADIRNTTLTKKQVTIWNYDTYDLETSTDGKKYSVNTFFDDYAQQYLNSHYALPCSKLINVDDGSFQSVSSVPYDNEIYGRYVSVITPGTNPTFSEIYDSSGYALYIQYPYDERYNADIYLISENDKIITWDRHQDDKYAIGGSKYRGFYVHAVDDGSGTKVAPKLKKIIVAHRDRRIPNSYETAKMYYEKYSTQKDRMQKLYDHPIKNIVYKTNGFKFETDFDENLFVVTQMPYEEGWTVTATLENGKKKNLDVYVAQGGYTSFIAEKGNVKYLLEFYPKYLKEGQLLSVVGALIFLSTFYGYYLYTYEYKRKEEIQKIFLLNK